MILISNLSNRKNYYSDIPTNCFSEKGGLPLIPLRFSTMGTPADGHLSIAATTPRSIFDEEKFLMPYYVKPKRKWYDARNVPFAILTASILQIIFHVFFTSHLGKIFRFEPTKYYEVWRFVTYMLIHDDWYHLTLNVVIQCIFALLLESRQGHIRVLLLYLLGGITGVFGASCVHPDLVIGASAGVYSLLISNVADIVLNYGSIGYKVYRAVSIGILVLFDVVYDVVHFYSKKEPLISWEAHFVGGIAGLLLGLILFKSDQRPNKASKINQVLFWISLTLYCALLISFLILTVQIKKCTPLNMIHIHYVYFC